MKLHTKQLLWWLYTPNDEREEQLYFKAYQRSFLWLKATVFTLMIILLTDADRISNVIHEHAYLVLGVITAAVAIAHIVGMHVLRHEELSISPSEQKKIKQLRNSLIIPIITSIAVGALGWATPVQAAGIGIMLIAWGFFFTGSKGPLSRI